MRRPQSAKNGHKGVWAQMSSDGLSDQQNNDQPGLQHRKKIKIVRPDFSSNDFGRVVPKKIQQDKERLYSEALHLKQVLNQTLQQNTRLKTKVAILEKEKGKMNRFIESSEVGLVNKAQSRLNMYTNKSSEKENTIVRNLKKMIRQSKDENSFLKQQMMKTKKAIKYTKINELQIQRKMLQEENKRINVILEELSERVSIQNDLEKQNKQIRRYLEEVVQNNKQLTDANENYANYIEDLQEKFRQHEEKNAEKQKKLQRDIALTKRRLNEEVKLNDQLRKEIKSMKEPPIENKKKPQNNIRPISSNPYSKKNNHQITAIQGKDFQQLKKKNQTLCKELNEVKLKLHESQNNLKNIKNYKGQSNEQKNKNKAEEKQKNDFIINEKEKEMVDKNKASQFIMIQKQIESKIQKEFIIDQKNTKTQKSPQNYNYQEESYEEFGKQQSDKKQPTKEKIQQSKQQLKQHSEIQQYKRDFNQQSQNQQQIYQKQPTDKKPKKSNKDAKQLKDHKQKKQTKQKKGYKPEKEVLSKIKQLLTYRMKAQRYPFQQLKKDIEASNEKQFHFLDLQNMLKSQPFYLNANHSVIVLKYIFEKQNIKKDNITTSENLVKKLRKLIDDFQLIPEQQQQQDLLKIAQMTSAYPSELELSFERVKNGEGTVSKASLIQMFTKLQLEPEYIELIISELSLTSEDLDHLSFYSFFERFFINEDGNEHDNQPIDEEQVQSSVGSSSKHITKKSTRKEPKKDNNEQSDNQQFILKKDEKMNLSIGGQEDYEDDEGIISDDGKI